MGDVHEREPCPHRIIDDCKDVVQTAKFTCIPCCVSRVLEKRPWGEKASGDFDSL
jgi:hypothetical protein